MANSAASVVFRTCAPQMEDGSFLELPLCPTLQTSRQGAVSGPLWTLPTLKTHSGKSAFRRPRTLNKILRFHMAWSERS